MSDHILTETPDDYQHCTCGWHGWVSTRIRFARRLGVSVRDLFEVEPRP